MEIGDRLRIERERLGMTQAELAGKIGVSKATVTLWENHRNRRQISTKHLQNVADALGMRLTDFLGENEPADGRPGPLDKAETQLVRLFRLMPEELKLFQLATFVECARASRADHALGHDLRGNGAERSPENSESR